MNLEKLFHLYLEQAKNRVLTLQDNDRTKACQWIKKIELAPIQEVQVQKLQLHSLKLLLLSLESNCLTGPFEEPPEEDKEFTQYNWDSYQLSDFSNMIRSKQNTGKRSEVSYAVSGNRRELVTHQDDPATGQHCYYACSKQPIEEWSNLQGGCIKNESIDQWKERGELEELNRTESRNSSVEIPRCVMHTTNSEVNFNLNDDRYCDRNSSRCQRIPNSSNNPNFVTPGPSRHTNYQKIYTARPETPQVFGGRGQANRPYEMEQFELSQNEQFRSPRGVFQNLDYDRFQTHRSPMPPRLTDEVIDSFENARVRRGPLSEVKDDNAKQQLCARLQTIREGMHKKPQVEIEHEIEIEPDMIPYERITLQEPCDDICRHQETEQDLGILSESDMDDEDLFAAHQTIDPRTIFKTKDENLVSRNVVKIETNTTINGSKREVIEEILEKEDVNVVERTEADENLVDVSEPNFESLPSGHFSLESNDHNKKKSEQWKSKPRRVIEDYSDLTQENLEDISKPSFSCQEHDEGKYLRTPREHDRFYSGRPYTFLPHIETSERLDEVSHPRFLSSIEDTYQHSSPRNRCPRSQKPLPQVETSERLDQVSHPRFLSSRKDTHQDSTRRTRCPTSQRPLPQVDTSERLDQVSHPRFLSSREDTHQDSTRRTRFSSNQRPLPQIDTSERLDEISNPSFMASYRESTVPSSRGRGMSSNRWIPQVDTSERLDEVSQPRFLHSTNVSNQDSTRRTRCPRSQRPLPQMETSEKLDEISHPKFLSSIEDTNEESTRRTKCLRSQRPLPQVETSERLDQVSHPHFLSSREDTCEDSSRRSRCPRSHRPLPQIDTSERLDEISNPSFMASYRDSTVSTRQGRGMSPNRRLPQVDTSERLDEVSQPRFLHSAEVSHQDSIQRSRCRTSRRPLPQVETSEQLDQVSRPGFLSSVEDPYQNSTRRTRFSSSQRPLPQMETSQQLDQVSCPQFLSSIEDTSQDSPRRTRCLKNQRPLPQIDTSERLDEISNPSFMSSFQDSTVPSRRGKGMSSNRRLPQVDISERLDDVSQPRFLHSTEVSHQDSTKRTRCPTNQRMVPKFDESEWLDDVCQPEYQSSYQTSSIKNTGISRQYPKQIHFPSIDVSERIENICQPEFPSSFEDNKQQSTRQTQNRNSLTKKNISERLDDVSQPFCPSSFEDSMQRLDVNAQTSGISDQAYYRDFSPKEVQISQAPRQLPQVEESELLDGVTQPSFDDTGYGSKDSSQRVCPEIEDLERLEDISQPHFQSTYGDSILRSREKRRIEEARPFPSIDTSERLDNICQPDFPNSFEASIRSDQSRCQSQKMPLPQCVECERLQSVCQPSFQSSLEDSNRSQKRSIHTPHPALRFTTQESSQISGRRKQDLRQRLLSRVDTSERLDDVSQPFHPSSFEDSMYDHEERLVSKKIRDKESKPIKSDSTSHRPFHQVSESDHLENVSQPVFHSSFEDSRHTESMSHETPQRRPRNKTDTSERLTDVSEPLFPTSFEDSMQNSGRYIETPRRRPLPVIDISEKLEDFCHPSFGSSFEESSNRLGRCQNMPMRRPFPQVNESEKLDDESQPDFVSTLKHTTAISRGSKLYSSHVNESGKSRSKQISVKHGQSLDNRPFPQTDISERLNDISQPDFPTSFENTVQRSMRTSEQRGLDQTEFSKQKSAKNSHGRQQRYPEIDISERLDDVSRPTFEDSKDYSRRNESISNQESFPTEMQENVHHLPNVPCSLDQYGGKSRHLPMQQTHRDTSEMLEDVMEPEFPPSFQDSMNVSSERKRITGVGKRPMPKIDLSENIESICQPEFPVSFEDSSRNDMQQNVSSTYRKNKDHVISFPQENLAEISAPTFNSNYEDSMQRGPGRGNSYLPQENLEEISCPSFQTTPKLPPRNRHREEYQSKGPQRQLFPKKDSTNEGIERPGDFRQVFESMPNYAPFEQQVASKRNPVPSRLKLPVTFGQTVAPSVKNYDFGRTDMVYPRSEIQPPFAVPSNKHNALPKEDFRSSRMRDQSLCQANPCKLQIPTNRNQMEQKRPARTVSSTRIPLPPSARPQKNVQRSNEIEIPANQERLVKKSSVKFHQTKSTYFKNNPEKSNERQSRR